MKSYINYQIFQSVFLCYDLQEKIKEFLPYQSLKSITPSEIKEYRGAFIRNLDFDNFYFYSAMVFGFSHLVDFSTLSIDHTLIDTFLLENDQEKFDQYYKKLESFLKIKKEIPYSINIDLISKNGIIGTIHYNNHYLLKEGLNLFKFRKNISNYDYDDFLYYASSYGDLETNKILIQYQSPDKNTFENAVYSYNFETALFYLQSTPSLLNKIDFSHIRSQILSVANDIIDQNFNNNFNNSTGYLYWYGSSSLIFLDLNIKFKKIIQNNDLTLLEKYQNIEILYNNQLKLCQKKEKYEHKLIHLVEGHTNFIKSYYKYIRKNKFSLNIFFLLKKIKDYCDETV